MSAFAAAGITAYVPGPNLPMPYYFTGTKARAGGWVHTDEGHLTDMWFYLGEGQSEICVREWHQVQGSNIFIFEGGLPIMFDSSHFPHGTMLKVRMKGKNSLGATAEAEDYALVKNSVRTWNLTAFTTIDGGDGGSEVISQMTGKNYSLAAAPSGWGADAMADALDNAGIWYVNSHGSTSLQETDQQDSESDATYFNALTFYNPNIPEYNSYENWRTIHNGSGYPPYNSTGDPYIAFALLDCCNNGTPDALYEGWLFKMLMIPGWDAYGWLRKDQAVFSWPGNCFTAEAENSAWWFFSLV